MASIKLGYNKINEKQQIKVLEAIKKQHLLPFRITSSKFFFEERYIIDGVTFALVYEPQSSSPHVLLYV